MREKDFLKETSKYLGIPYRIGGSTRKGTDCSGLIRQIYGDLFSLDLPHNAAAQKKFTQKVPQQELKAGDLVFFGSKNGRINHIGAYLSDGKFIHASRKSGVTISRLSDPYWRKRFVCSGRIPGIELNESETYCDADNQGSPGNHFRWSMATLQSDTGSGMSSDVLLDSFVDLKMETFFLMQDLQPFQSGLLDPPTEGKFIGNMEQFSLRHGVRLSTGWTPFTWLQLAPYWTYVIDSDPALERSSDMTNMGLSAEIVHPDLRWSFSFAAQPSQYSLQTERSYLWDTDWRDMDLFFGCRYRISDTWKFSLFGTGRFGMEETDTFSSLGNRELSLLPDGIDELAVRLDFAF
ncbi:MAG: C40 family peptidase [Thermodesulfobacteriota bacterium]